MSETTRWERGLDRRPARTLLLMGAVGIVITFILAALGWGLMTGFSFFKGQGDAYSRNNSAQNWTSAQRAFNQQYQDVGAFRQKIVIARQQLTDFDRAHTAPATGAAVITDPQERQGITTNISGLQQQCLNTVANYNTDAQSYLTEDWRDARLPQQLDSSYCN